MSAVTVRPLEVGDEPAWERFVQSCPDATFFHRAGWRRVMEKSFGHPTHFLLAERGGAIAGVLPLVHVKSRLFGNALVSTAFGAYGGPAASDAEARRALTARAVELADKLGVDHLEYRSVAPSEPAWARKSELYVTFRRDLPDDPEKILGMIPGKRRNMVRKGLKAGLDATFDDNFDRHYPVYATSVRNLGTPVFPRRYFEAIRAEFGDATEIMTISDGGEAVTSAFSFYFRDEVTPYYVGGTLAARKNAAFDVMYWHLHRRAIERGCRVYDFGRSKRGTGSFDFKVLWGFEPTPLHYEYYLPRGGEVPDINPLNPKYRLFIEVWKRLPLPIANILGPRIIRSLG